MAHWLASDEIPQGFVLVARDPTGEPAGACVNRIRTDYNQQHGKKEGEVTALGVRRAFRRKGLARALLLQSLHVLKQAGMDTAELSVDSINPLGANQLYKSVGFTQRKTSVVYQAD
jgi:mycothiol synthase